MINVMVETFKQVCTLKWFCRLLLLVKFQVQRVLKCACKLPEPNEVGRALGTVTYMYNGITE
jgi:hypothetical protein